MKKFFNIFFTPILFFCLTVIYLFPLLQGLILMPLDLLIFNYAPWYAPGTILLKNSYMQDSVLQFIPWRHFVFESLSQGIIPFWNPYQHLGLPFMANLKTMVFYPLNILFIFGEIRAWNLLLFSQIFLSMLFAYYLAREFTLKMIPSIFISISFALNSYMIGLLEFGSDSHTIVWWPLLILFAKRYIDKKQGRYLLLLGITLSIGIFAGQLQFLSYFMFIFVAFIIFYGLMAKAKTSVYIMLFCSILLGVGINTVQLLPSIELFSRSHRGLLLGAQNHEVFARGLISPDKLFRLLAPDFFGNPVTNDVTIGYIEMSGYFGIIPLFFAFFAMIFSRKNSFVRFFSVVFIISLLLSLRGLGELLYILRIPLITSGSGERIFILVLFSGTFLSGFGLSAYIAMASRKKQLTSVLAFLLLFIIVVAGSFFSSINSSQTAFLQHIKFPSLILGIFSMGSIIYILLLSWKKQKKLLKIFFLLFILAITFFDLFRFGYRFLTFSNKKFLYPEMGVTKFIQNASRLSLSRTFGLTEPELGTYLNVYTIEAYNPLYLLRTAEFLQSLQKQSPRSLSVDNKYFLTSTGSNLKNTLDLMGTKYIVATKDENPSTKYFYTSMFEKELQKIYSDERYSVYENLKAYPRFTLYYHYIIGKNDKDVLNIMTKGNIDLRKNIILEEDLPIKIQEGTGSAKLLSSTVNAQKFEVTTTKSALFYISDTFYPGWKVKVNNTQTKIYRANYNFRAVVVPQGKSVVEFIYMPINFTTGIFISIFSLLLLVILAIKQKSFFSIKKI